MSCSVGDHYHDTSSSQNYCGAFLIRSYPTLNAFSPFPTLKSKFIVYFLFPEIKISFDPLKFCSVISFPLTGFLFSPNPNIAYL